MVTLDIRRVIWGAIYLLKLSPALYLGYVTGISLTGIAFLLSLWEAMAYHVLVMTFGLRATLLISHKMCRGGPKDSPPCCILVGCYTVVSRMRRAPGSTTFTQVVLSLKDICHLISLYVENIISCLSSDKLSSKQV